ncbi:UNVERIFIED_ORG: hypothetical protein QE446_005092 [Rhizobium sp. SORGH_AS260]|uniref:hypothetical protein n=1 Tax=Agrobacterium sp. SORGH_AS_0440 TaxID=3041757 RepID=UPI002783DF26|nr:hypothetical protein [Agrobacterium sp. SORGH_AS_0440]MDP9757168.1 hypothetical protein [Rhizobium sp. SORGH_AS_0260]MDR6084093.1 hypothetical protein [Agrobacterium sp. SORGH_AS_0440]
MTMKSDDVITILGPVDETLVADVIATGATQAELSEAVAWINNDEALIGEGRRLPAGRVAALVDLLTADEEEQAD